MKIVIDVNLSPRWVDALSKSGIEAVHWSSVGALDAKDHEIIAWARENGAIVLTHDLDFAAILALTRAAGPSVVQIRAQDVLPEARGSEVIEIVRRYRDDLARGVLISLDETTARIRILPILGRTEGS